MASSANYFNMTPFDASQLNDPNFMPSFALTEEDRRRMMQQALFQAGLGMIANNGKGSAAQIGGALQGGLLGYQQGAQAPQARYQQAKELLDFQGKQLGNQKSSMELQQQRNLGGLLSNITQMTASPAEMGGPMSPDSPEFGMGATQKQAQAFNNPAIIAALLANGMKGSDIAAAGGRFDPREMKAGSYYQNPLTSQMDYLPQLDKGMGMRGGQVVNAPGYVGAAQDQTLGNKAAEAFAELQRRKMLDPGEVAKAGAVAGAVKAAEFPFQTEDYVDQGGNTRKRFLAESTGVPGRAPNMYPGYSVSPQQQMQRDQVAQGVLDAEGNGQKFNPRLNDRPGAPMSPQVQDLPRGAYPNALNPVTQASTKEGIKASVENIGKSRDKASEMLSSVLAMNEAMNAVNGGAYQGKFADFKTSAAALAAVIPGLDKMIDPQKLENSQVASKHLSEQLLGRIKALGANPSNADRDYILKTIPMLTNDPGAFTRLANYMQSMSLRAIESHNKSAGQFHSTQGLSPQAIGMNYRVEIPKEISQKRDAVRLLLTRGTPQERERLRAMGYFE